MSGVWGRVPPNNPTAEAALLGALLSNNKAYDRVCDVVRPEYFAIPAYGEIYAAIAQRVDAGRIADGVVMASYFGEAMADNGDGTETPMRAVIAQVMSAMVGIINAREYALAVADAWHRRQLIDIGEQLVNEAFAAEARRPDGQPITARDIHEATESRLFEVSAMLTDAGEVHDAADSVQEALAMAEAASKRPQGIVGVASGLDELDDLTGGFRDGQLIILGARPSMGKTAAALAISVGAAERGHEVLFVSAEMPHQQIGTRMLSGLSGLPGEYADRGLRRERDAFGRFVYTALAQEDWSAMVAVRQRMMRAERRFPLVIDECRQRTMAAIRSRARQLQRKRKLGLVVIDYLGLLRVPELARSDNRVLEVSRISADAKALAKDLGVPVVLLSQLNRAVEGREDRRPRLSDLRDSGSLEQDADIVMFLHREHYYLKKEPVKRRGNETEEKLVDRQSAWLTAVQQHQGKAQLFIDKHRNGPIGVAELAFNETNGWISNLPPAGAGG